MTQKVSVPIVGEIKDEKVIYKESYIQKQILDYLRARKIFCWKTNNVGIYKKETGSYIPVGMKGVSDILGLLPNGRLLAIEVKNEKGKPSQHQLDFILNINGNGGLAFIARNVQEVENHLDNTIG